LTIKLLPDIWNHESGFSVQKAKREVPAREVAEKLFTFVLCDCSMLWNGPSKILNVCSA
jgi:hypothetical protein